MGRGSSGISAYFPLDIDFDSRPKVTNATATAVKLAIDAKADGDVGDVRRALEKIKPGQQVSTYSWEYSNGGEVKGAANDITVWTKGEDGDWHSLSGTRTNGDMARSYVNNGPGSKLDAGALTTESRVQITGTRSKDYDGVNVTAGTYDILASGTRVGNNGPRKVMETGNIATYNGTQYGLTKKGGQYVVTHIPTGLSLGESKAKTVTQAAAFIRDMDSRVKSTRGIDDAARRFAITIRYD